MQRAILAAFLCVCASSAFAETTSIDGCDVRQIENSNAYQRVDLNCSFKNAASDRNSAVETVDEGKKPVSGPEDDDSGPLELPDFPQEPIRPIDPCPNCSEE